jgi:hypothetical protein
VCFTLGLLLSGICSYLVYFSDVGGDENACIIMHKMIIESEHNALVVDDRPHNYQGPIAKVDHEVPVEFGAFIAIHREILDEQVHVQLQDDLVNHLWARRGNTP